MKIVLSLVVVVSAAGAGCRTAHMGENHGQRYRAALRAQTDRSTQPVEALDAADARRVLEAHRNGASAGPGAAPAAPQLESN